VEPPIALDEIRTAHERIRSHVERTPLVALPGTSVTVKAESLQPVGSFKLRGAVNTLLGLDADQRQRGIVAHSSGNHAIAVAHAGALLGIPVTVVMPEDAPTVKLARTRAHGARVVIVGPGSDARVERAAQLASAEGLALVEPYDARAIVVATATIAVEILEDLDAGSRPIELYVPVSGGGLAAGVALGATLLDPDVRIVTVEPEVAATYLASRRAGHRVALPAEQMARTAADGLRVQQVGELPWAILQQHVDEAVTVSEDEIADAREVVGRAGLASEPSGVVSVAAALRRGRSSPGCPVAVLTGQNADP
jgi:threonine dehydratase